VSADAVVLGAITGLTYAILAVGLILIWGSNRFVNFAHGSLGAFASVLLAKVVVDFHVSYWLALPAMLIGAAALNGVIEATIIRRFFDAPRLVLVVATIALGQLLFFFSLLEDVQPDRTVLAQSGFPVPFHASVKIGGVTLNSAHLMIIVFVPLLAAALVGFLRFTSYGQAIRAAAENPDAARLAGISAKRMSAIVWVIAGVLAASTAILLAPLRASFAIETLGPSVLVRALAAALIARMSSIPVAFATAMVIGIAEGMVFAETLNGGLTDLIVFGVVLVTLLIRGRQLTQTLREGQSSGVGFGAELPAMARELARSAAVRRMRAVAGVVALVAVVVMPLVPGLDSSEQAFRLALTTSFAIVGVSLTILTGWSGQVSLGQYALVGVGAFVTYRLGVGAPLPVVVVVAAVIGAAAAVVVGVPALRIQGLFLAVTTLAFAVVATGWVFLQRWAVGQPNGAFVTRPPILRSERSVYYFGLVMLLTCLWLARNLRRSGPGRMLVAVRDNDAAARSAGVSAAWTRLVSFAISGAMAGVAGTVFAYARTSLRSGVFAPADSLNVLLMVVVGGLGSLTGAVLGAVFMFGIPALFGSSDLTRLLTSSVGVLIVLLYLPGGLASVFASGRDALAYRLARKELGLPPAERTLPPLRNLWGIATGRAFKVATGRANPKARV
jgi:ABC-type branched-subunit amino acid transport system permease subunit